MPRYHFDIHENGVFIPDKEAKEAFITGSACQVVIDVREDDAPPYLKVSILLSVDQQ